MRCHPFNAFRRALRRRSSASFPSAPILAVALGAIFATTTPVASARVVHWSSNLYAENIDSQGDSLDASYQFSLGVFAGGFVPSPDNLDQWEAHWIELATAAYDPAEACFSSVASGASASGATGQAYIWGYNRRELTTGPEWVLLTHSNWVWSNEAAGATPAPAMAWTTGDAAQAIVGAINDGAGPHIKTSQVEPAKIAPEAWLASQFGGPEVPDANWTADPDGDGASNLLEYALGRDPNRGNAGTAPAMERISEGGTAFQRVTVTRNPYAAAVVECEVSTDLVNWTVAPAGMEIVEDRPDLLVVQDPVDSATPSRFYRLRVNLAPAPPDGT